MSKVEYLLEIQNLHKEFEGNTVLDDVSLTLQNGEVHALVGGNGAGKSTLMKIITGLYKADRGAVKVKGHPVTFRNTYDAHRNGIYLVPQEPLIFPNMSVEENISMGLPGSKLDVRKKIYRILNRLGWKLDLQRKAHLLAVAEKQLVEVVRGLVREAEILILDEPTSALTFGEIESLFATIKQLRNEGIGIFYITHRFSEIFILADSVSVLRDGHISASGPVSEFNYEKLVQGLVSEHVRIETTLSEDIEEAEVSHMPKKLTLQVVKLGNKHFHDISFDIYSGEIVGIAGVVGAGRTELVEAISGMEPVEAGKIFLDDKEMNALNSRQRMNHGLVYVPEDRLSHGIFPITSIKNNISSIILYKLKGLFLPIKREKELSLHYISELKVKATHMSQELKDLSGGNQQKVVLSKYLATTPKVIILDEPTRGIDASARNDIYRIIRKLKRQGLAVLLISSDMEEIQKLSDRVLVMHEGRIVNVLQNEEVTIENITSSAFGVKKGGGYNWHS
ncbi:sugar ABC transporter ATP-binding protein [Bacillus massiliigorillae]|uniref:sugar ABC transporter ATP-binding protein n=1 Tax=Bacillus massiliigorillae TaxID=1243664 RepID=UPI0003A7227A|nr:sugar ABC transporter ATP-binding protein [Bacillus massiliigorillae]